MELLNLIEEVKQGNKEAFEELYNKYYSIGFSLACQIVKSEEEAMDIIQDSFVTLYSKINTLEDSKKFKSWYLQIVANKCRDFLKKKNPLIFTELNTNYEEEAFEYDIADDNRDFQPEESADYSETVRIVNEMLKNLPEEQKMCLLLYYVNGLKISEIAEAFEISESTVKSRIKYGKEKLKTQVEEYEKKNNTKLRGIAPLSILPFIKWMLNIDSSTNKATFTKICEGIGADAFTKTSITGVINGAQAVCLTAKTLSASKIVAIIAAGVLAVTAVSAVVISKFSDNNLISMPVNSNTSILSSDKDENKITTSSVSSKFEETSSKTTTSSMVNTSSKENTSLKENDSSKAEEVVDVSSNSVKWSIFAFTDKDLSKNYDGEWTKETVYIQLPKLQEGERILYKIKTEDNDFIELKDTKVVVDKEGEYIYQFKKVTNDSTESKILSMRVRIDKTKPTISTKISNKYDKESIANQKVMVDIAGGDAGIDDIKDLAELEEFDKKYISEDVEDIYGYWKGDEIGGPTSREHVVQVLTAREWISNSEANILVDTNDSIAGIKSIKYSINGKTYTVNEAKTTIENLPNGVYKLDIAATDFAGNINKKSLNIKKDDRRPKAEISTKYVGGYSKTPVSVTFMSDKKNISPVYIFVAEETSSNGFASENDRLIFNGVAGGGFFEKREDGSVETYEYEKLTLDLYAMSEAGLQSQETIEGIEIHVDLKKPYLKIEENIDGYQLIFGDEDSPIKNAYFVSDGKKTILEVEKETNRGWFFINKEGNNSSKQFRFYLEDSAGHILEKEVDLVMLSK